MKTFFHQMDGVQLVVALVLVACCLPFLILLSIYSTHVWSTVIIWVRSKRCPSHPVQSGHCEKCGETGDGKSYCFHYGRKVREELSAWFTYGTGVARWRTIHYDQIHTSSAFICQSCVDRVIKHRLKFPALVVVIAAAFLTNFTLLRSLLGNPSIALLCMTSTHLLFTFSIIQVLSWSDDLWEDHPALLFASLPVLITLVGGGFFLLLDLTACLVSNTPIGVSFSSLSSG